MSVLNGSLCLSRPFHSSEDESAQSCLLTPRKDSLKRLVAPNCHKKFANLQEYLREVSQALGQRQSFYSLNLADILWKIQKWKDMLPDVDFFYAVKANPDPVLLKLLVLIGTSFDCATEGEIEAVLKAGASPTSILWAHTVKPEEGLIYAREVGVDAMTYDDEEELQKIHRAHPSARLLLRVRPSVVKCKFDLSDKFGCGKSQAGHLLRLAKQLDMTVLGISFHVGALCTDPESFSATIKDCRDIFDEGRQMGLDLTMLDIGGGFFGASGTEPIFSEIAEKIHQSLDEYFGDIPVQVIAEPGCYLTGSAFDLVCTVLGKRTVQEAGGVRKHYFLNNGIYGSFFRDIESYDVHVKPLLSESVVRDRSVFQTTIFGQTCCSEDVIQRDGRLPELEAGERVVWDNMGAYSSAVCSTFCGVPLPYTVYVFDHDPRWNLKEIFACPAVRDFLKTQVVFIGGSEKLLD